MRSILRSLGVKSHVYLVRGHQHPAVAFGRPTSHGGDPDGAILPTGTMAPADGNPTYETIETPNVRIGGHSVQVIFSGIAPGFAGLYQINVQVPQGLPVGDEVSLNIATADGLADTATIAIQH